MASLQTHYLVYCLILLAVKSSTAKPQNEYRLSDEELKAAQALPDFLAAYNAEAEFRHDFLHKLDFGSLITRKDRDFTAIVFALNKVASDVANGVSYDAAYDIAVEVHAITALVYPVTARNAVKQNVTDFVQATKFARDLVKKWCVDKLPFIPCNYKLGPLYPFLAKSQKNSLHLLVALGNFAKQYKVDYKYINEVLSEKNIVIENLMYHKADYKKDVDLLVEAVKRYKDL